MKTRSAPAQTFHVVTAVWGDEFLQLFLTVNVPNQSTRGNLEALPAGSRYRIFTRPQDVPVLDGSEAVAELRRSIAVDIVSMDGVDFQTSNRYSLMTSCHQRAVAEAAASEAALIFLSGDTFMATHTLARLTEWHARGRRAVVCTGVRLAKESFLEALSAREPGIDGRDLVRLAMRHLHPFTLDHLADGPRFAKFPTAVYWRAGSTGLIARNFHLHPLLVDPLRRDVLPKGTIDGRYLARACGDAAAVHVVTDSDDLVVFELSPAARSIAPTVSGGSRLWRTAAVASTCDARQLEFWKLPVRLHADDLDATWRDAEAQSAAFADSVVRFKPVGAALMPLYRRGELIRQQRDRCKRAWRRRAPRVRAKQLARPLTLAWHRAAKSLRKRIKHGSRLGRTRQAS